MKKILRAVLILLALALILALILIPRITEVSSEISAPGTQYGTARFLADPEKDTLWWPGRMSHSGDEAYPFLFEDNRYQLHQALYNTFAMQILFRGDTLSGLLQILPAQGDSITLVLKTSMPPASNLFSRIPHYFQSLQLKKQFDHIVGSLGKALSDPKNVYGINIKKEKVQVEYLVATRKEWDHYPSTAEIYDMIHETRRYIQTQGATEEQFPMLNIRRIDSSLFAAQIALPVNKQVPDSAQFASKWMFKGGNILSAEVTGGPSQVQKAMKQFDLYIKDFQRTPIAIPFQSLETDRSRETDSTRWKTRIFYPVM